MNLVKDVTFTKVAATLVGVAMVAGLAFSVAAERAHAVTLAELVELFIALDIIPADKAADARAVLSNQPETTTGGTTTGGSCAFTFTRDLKLGSSGTDVMNLQKLLNMSADTQVSVAGAGSPGMETSYFGPATKAAVSKFQVKYAADILAPLGLTAGTGNFGVSTRAKANAVCAGGGTAGTPPTPPTAPGGGTGSSTDDDNDDDSLSGGEASISNFDVLSSPSGEDVGEGDELVKVAGFEFDVDDADVSLNRVDVRFEATTGDTGFSDEPWDTFESVALYLGDEKIAEMNADNEDDWDDADDNSYEMRFTNLSEKISEGDTAELFVAVTVQSNLDEDDDNTTWEVSIPNDGIRARDASGIDQYEGADGNTRSFSTEAAGTGDELKIALDSSNPEDSTIKVDNEEETEDQTILVFTLEAEGGDIEVSQIPLTLATSSGTSSVSDMVASLKLEIDGVVYDDLVTGTGMATLANATGSSLFLFDLSDDKLTIDEDDKVQVKVIVDLKQQKNNYWNGSALTASISSAVAAAFIEAEGADDLDGGDISGSAIGEAQTLQTAGVFAEAVSDNADTTVKDGVADTGTFVIKFDVSAFDQDAFINNVATRDGSGSVSGVDYVIQDANGATTTGAVSAVLSSTADEESDEFKVVDDASAETFTLTVTFTPAATGVNQNYRAVLTGVNFAETAGGTVSKHTPSPVEDFRTDYVNIGA